MAAVVVVALAGAWRRHRQRGQPGRRPGHTAQPTLPPAVEAQQLANIPKGKLLPLRTGEHRMTLTMPEAYTPVRAHGTGTDDYRCFLLDPHVDQDMWLTGSNVLPGNPNVVHHVILFKIPPDSGGRGRGQGRGRRR